MEDTTLALGHVEIEVPVGPPVEKCLLDQWVYGFGIQMFGFKLGLEIWKSYVSDSGSHVPG